MTLDDYIAGKYEPKKTRYIVHYPKGKGILIAFLVSNYGENLLNISENGFHDIPLSYVTSIEHRPL